MTNLEKALHKAARYGHDRKQGWQAFCEEWAGGLDALADNQALERLQRTLLTGYLPNDGAAADHRATTMTTMPATLTTTAAKRMTKTK